MRTLAVEVELGNCERDLVQQTKLFNAQLRDHARGRDRANLLPISTI